MGPGNLAEGLDYPLCLKLHAVWLGYMRQLLPPEGPIGQPAAALFQERLRLAELRGSIVRVEACRQPRHVGLQVRPPVCPDPDSEPRGNRSRVGPFARRGWCFVSRRAACI